MKHDEIHERYKEIKERHEASTDAFTGLGVIKDARNLQDIIAGIGGLPDHLQHIVTGLNDITDSISKNVE